MSCECRGSRPGHEYDCKPECEAAKRSRLAAAGQLVCECHRPIDIAVQNCKGLVSSTDCARCGKQLRDQKRPWRYLDTAPDPDVLAVFRAESRWERENWAGRTDLGDFEKTTAKYLTASYVRAPEFMAWLDGQGKKLPQQHLKKAAEWRSGKRPRITIWTVDRIVAGFGRHVSELPDGVFE